MDGVQERYTSSNVQACEKQEEHHLKPFDDLLEYLREYARERPEVTIFTCLGIGFILGWRLKPW